MYQINSKAENAISPLQLLLQNCIASLTAPFCIPLLFYLCIQISNAAPVEHPTYEPGVLYLPDRAIAVDDGYRLSIQGVLGGIVLIVCGILLAFRSVWDRSRAGTGTQSLSGFVTMGFVTWIMLANFEPDQTYGTNRQTIYFIVPLVVGFVTSCFMSVTIQLYLMLVGGLGGLAFGLWILGWKEDFAITSNYGRAILLTVLVVVFMVMSLYHCFWHKLGAAIAGSYIFFMGLDIYFHTGFLYCFTTVLDVNHEHHYKMYRGVYIMQSCLIISYLVGYVAHRHDHINTQHGFLMTTLRDPMYKSQLMPVRSFMPGMAPSRWMPTWIPWRRNPPAQVIPPAPVTVAPVV